MIQFRVRYMSEPHIPHVYCRVFVATDGGTYASLGSLILRSAEFEAFKAAFRAEFIEEGIE